MQIVVHWINSCEYIPYFFNSETFRKIYNHFASTASPWYSPPFCYHLYFLLHFLTINPNFYFLSINRCAQLSLTWTLLFSFYPCLTFYRYQLFICAFSFILSYDTFILRVINQSSSFSLACSSGNNKFIFILYLMLFHILFYSFFTLQLQCTICFAVWMNTQTAVNKIFLVDILYYVKRKSIVVPVTSYSVELI